MSLDINSGVWVRLENKTKVIKQVSMMMTISNIGAGLRPTCFQCSQQTQRLHLQLVSISSALPTKAIDGTERATSQHVPYSRRRLLIYLN